MPFRGSLTSRDQVAVYDFAWPVIVFVPLAAIAIQAFLPVRVRFFPIIDLPMMVVIFFAVARRNPISGCLTGAVIGLLQDTLAGPAHPIGMYGIADTIIGFAASSLGVKIDVENHGTRFLITYLFFVAHQGDLLRSRARPVAPDRAMELAAGSHLRSGQRLRRHLRV